MSDPKNTADPKKTEPVDPKKTTGGTPEPKTYTVEEIANLVNAAKEDARKDEKAKVYARIEAEKKAKEDAEALVKIKEEEAAAAKKAAEALQKKTDEINASQLSDAEKALAREKAMTEQIKTLQGEIVQVAKDAQESVRRSNLAVFRQNKIAEAKLKHLSSMVSGDTEKDIVASVKVASDLEKSIYDDADAQAREKTKDLVPKPAVPADPNTAGGQARATAGADFFQGLSRREMAMLPPGEYEKARAALVASTKEGG